MAGWFKRSGLSSNQYFYSYDSGGNAQFVIGFYSTDKFTVYDRDASSGSDDINYVTTQVFRDTAAWYHFVVAVDTTDSTSGDRVKIYVNGTRLTAFDTSTAPAQDYDTIANSAVSKDIGRWQAGSNYYDGYMSQFIFLDGYALTPSSFGSTNANGVWIANTSPSVTYGNNGFKLDFADSGASAAAGNFGSDSSGNNNHFTSNNLSDNPSTTDTPHNVFATLNPLQNGYPPTGNVVTLSQGNLTAKETQSAWTPHDSTIATTSGKWYWECKNVSGSPATGVMFGIQSQEGSDITGIFSTDGRYPGYYSSRTGFSYHASGTYYYNGASTSTGSVAYTTGDIIMFALDMDNGFLYAGKNGTWNNSGNPTSGASGTGNVYNGFSGKPISPCNALNGTTILTSMNFGQPTFSIASGNADANGYGNFEYAVPSGYYALCTKNLAQYG